MSSRTKSEKYLQDAMRCICELMSQAGIQKEASLKALHAALDDGYRRRPKAKGEAQKISRLADVCTRWHFERNFVDSDGHPKPLRWNGKTGSLLQLARLVVGARHAREVVEALIAKRLVKRLPGGAWTPKSRVVAPTAADEAQIQRSSLMIDRLLRTVIYNSQRRYKGDVLLEVMAQVSRLPDKEISSFKRFAKAQGLTFAKAVDDWLEARSMSRSQRPRRSTNEIGVVAFAFVVPNE